MEVVSKGEFNTWEREKQVQYIKDVIGEECDLSRRQMDRKNCCSMEK